jgi:site-specific recombinase XerD
MLLEEFRRDLVGKNRAKNTLKSVDLILGKAQEHIGKPLETLTIEDIKKYSEGLRERGLQNNSIWAHQLKLIQFYDWCFDETDNEKYSTLSRKIKRIKVDRVKTVINPNEILLPEEIKKLINVATIERDRCIIASLYESGMRIGELLSLTRDMVQMDELKQEITFHIPNIEGCKTGSRSVVCLEIYGYVQDWLKCNPSKQFIPLKPGGIRKAIIRLFKLAGITKPCNIHHFRHSSITHAAGLNMSETQLSYRFWGIPHSVMLSIYIHLNEQLKSSGYRDAKGMGESNGKTIINPLSSRCVECGRLIQSGSICKQCDEIKKLKLKNELDMESARHTWEDSQIDILNLQKEIQYLIDKDKQREKDKLAFFREMRDKK